MNKWLMPHYNSSIVVVVNSSMCGLWDILSCSFTMQSILLFLNSYKGGTWNGTTTMYTILDILT